MAKRQSSNNKTLAGILSAVFLVLAVLIAQLLGVDVLTPEEDSDSSSSVTDSVSGDWYELYFTSPLNTNDFSKHVGAPTEIGLLNAINSAQQSIDGALFELNMESVTQAFINARQKGVRVRLVLDDEHTVRDEDSTLQMLRDAGMQVYCANEQPTGYDIRCDDRSAFMHNKFLIIDGAQVWMGSMNFTHNGIYNNNNNALLINSTRLVANYQSEFDEMFHDGIFTRSADTDNMPNRNVTINGVRVETYFSPEDGVLIEERIVELIEGANISVDMLANILTLNSISDAAIARHNDGVTVRAVFETRQALQRGAQMSQMGCVGIEVRKDGNPNTYHHKAIVIDNQIVITGSYNFSASARDDNSENVLIIHSPEIAQQFTTEFERNFSDPRAETPTRAEMRCG